MSFSSFISAFLKSRISFDMTLVHVGVVEILKDMLRWSECKKPSLTERSVTKSGVEVRIRSRIFLSRVANVFT